MKSNQATLLSLVIFQLLPLQGVHADDSEGSGKGGGRTNAANSPSNRVGKMYKNKFRNIHADELRELQTGADIETALQAAWILNTSPTVNPLSPSPQRFLGFLEGRTGITPPLRWEVRLVLDAYRNAPPEADAVLEKYLKLAPFLKRGGGGRLSFRYEADKLSHIGLGLTSLQEINLKQNGETVVVSVGQAKLVLAEKVIRDLLRQYNFLETCAVNIGTDVSVVAFYSRSGFNFPLIGVESKSGKVIWQTESWSFGGINIGPSSGPASESLSLVTTSNSVVLFGAGPEFYIESYDLKTGKNRYRFSTNYWWCREE